MKRLNESLNSPLLHLGTSPTTIIINCASKVERDYILGLLELVTLHQVSSAGPLEIRRWQDVMSRKRQVKLENLTNNRRKLPATQFIVRALMRRRQEAAVQAGE